MTNKENVDADGDHLHMVKSLAEHLVGQVLDESCIFINAAKQLSMKSLKLESRKTNCLTMGDNDKINLNDSFNSMTTSTPQKSVEILNRNVKMDTYIIGQGDDSNNSGFNDLQEKYILERSTSTFINHLFDMSDVEFKDTNETEKIISTEVLLYEEIQNIVISCLESAIDFTVPDETQSSCTLVNANGESHSPLDNAFTKDFDINKTFYISIPIYNKSKDSVNQPDNEERTLDNYSTLRVAEVDNTCNIYNEILNQDLLAPESEEYRATLEEDRIILEDLYPINLQKEDISVNTSILITSSKEFKDRDNTSAVTASTVHRKSGLVRRCRLQGARLLSCLRGWWWRRKLPGRRKEPRIPGVVRGQCPLTPSARQRAASLLDQRLLRSPSPSRPPIWKFNTINETMVNSDQWNDYAFKTKPDSDI